MIGVDFHPEFQQIASVDTDTGEFQEKRLTHCEEAERRFVKITHEYAHYAAPPAPAGCMSIAVLLLIALGTIATAYLSVVR